MKRLLVLCLTLGLVISCSSCALFDKGDGSDWMTDGSEECFCKFEDKDCSCDKKDGE